MAEDQVDIILLLRKSMDGELLSEQEQKRLENWRVARPDNNDLYQRLMDKDNFSKEFLEYYLLRKHSNPPALILPAEEYDTIEESVKSIQPSFRKKKLLWGAAAASAFIAISTYLFFSAAERAKQAVDFPKNYTSQSAGEVVLPAVQRASLSIANGQTIGLAQNSSVEINKDGSAVIHGNNEQGLPISPNTESSKEEIYTLTTPRGGFYNVTLADGTKVWLNAATVLKFSKSFSGPVRKVQLQGEAYFDVAKKVNHPFVIETDKGNVEVLGTTFNLKIYQLEPMVTSLLTGSVKVITGPEQQHAKIIAPGQQAIVRGNDAFINVGDIDNNPTAWRSNIFSFNKTSFKQVLQEISRWYNVEIDIKGNAAAETFLAGKFDRKLALEKLIPHLAEMTGLKIELKNKTIIVSNK